MIKDGLSQDELNELYKKHYDSPERIYLQDDYGGLQGRTWCENQIDSLDVQYIRMDLYDELKDDLRKERLFIALSNAKPNSQEASELLEQTSLFDEHPEWYDEACMCQLCWSYG